MTVWHLIASDSLLDNVDTPFRMRAGPGAGKTSWLALHIENVVKRSSRLTGASRIACISYTNVAAEEITRRLGAGADRVEVSTIHSFLYRNVVKPYLRLLRKEDGGPLVNYRLVDGHDEHRPSYPWIMEWLRDINQQWFWTQDKSRLMWYLERVRWLREKGGEWNLRLPATTKIAPPLPPKIAQGMRRYKAPYWKHGIIDHDDVLFLSYRILDEQPALLEFLSHRFPYLFIDEFQDTNPTQTHVVRSLAKRGTVVGVIGDPEQAIFGFQGAKREDFEQFSLPGSVDYEILGNHRSTNRIIALLNHVRRDGLQQHGHRSVEGEPVRVLVGTAEAVAAKARDFAGKDAELAVLARSNKTVGLLRGCVASDGASNPWLELEDCDHGRTRFLEQVIRGVELARGEQFSRVVSEVVKGIRVRDGELHDPLKYKGQVTLLDRQAIALAILEHLLTHYHEVQNLSLLSMYTKLGEVLHHEMQGLALKKVMCGKFKELAERTSCGSLFDGIVLGEEPRLARTIHKAKGTEFASVLVHFESDEQLARVIEPARVRDEEQEQEERRIAYVGLSRARDRLFLSIENFSAQQEDLVANLDVEVIRCQRAEEDALSE